MLFEWVLRTVVYKDKSFVLSMYFCQNAYILFVLGDPEELNILSAYWIAKYIKYIQEFYLTIEFIQNKDKIVKFPPTYISVFILQYTSPYLYL